MSSQKTRHQKLNSYWVKATWKAYICYWPHLMLVYAECAFSLVDLGVVRQAHWTLMDLALCRESRQVHSQCSTLKATFT